MNVEMDKLLLAASQSFESGETPSCGNVDTLFLAASQHFEKQDAAPTIDADSLLECNEMLVALSTDHAALVLRRTGWVALKHHKIVDIVILSLC